METDKRSCDLTRAFRVGPDRLSQLHDRLAATAQQYRILDTASRTIDSPAGPLLIAATDPGLIRVAYAREGHDAALQALADKSSPAHLARPRTPGHDRPRARGVLRRPPVQLRPAAALAAGRLVPPRDAEPPARYRPRAPA